MASIGIYLPPGLAIHHTPLRNTHCNLYPAVHSSDLIQLSSDIRTNTFVTGSVVDPIPFNEGSIRNFGLGISQVCMTNDNNVGTGMADTQLSLTDISDAVNNYIDTCCVGFGNDCAGGTTLVTGQNHVGVVVQIKPSNQTCAPIVHLGRGIPQGPIGNMPDVTIPSENIHCLLFDPIDALQCAFAEIHVPDGLGDAKATTDEIESGVDILRGETGNLDLFAKIFGFVDGLFDADDKKRKREEAVVVHLPMVPGRAMRWGERS